MAQDSRHLWRKVRYVQVFYSLVTKNSFREQEAEIENENVQEEAEVSSSRKAVISVYHICTSHLGLVILLLLYTFAGAGFFNAIEGRKNRTSDKILLEQERNATLNDITLDIQHTDLTNTQLVNVTRILEQYLLEYEHRLLAKGLLVRRKEDSEIWSYWAAVGFCMSVYTTIGYGHMAPETTAGRWLCIVYAIIGIPLCLITLADLGLSFSKSLKYFYRKARLKYIKRQKTWFVGCCAKQCCTRTDKEDTNEKVDALNDYPDATSQSPPNTDSPSTNGSNAAKSSSIAQEDNELDTCSTSLLPKGDQRNPLDSVVEENSNISETNHFGCSKLPETHFNNGCKDVSQKCSSPSPQSPLKHLLRRSNEIPGHRQPQLNDKERATAHSVVNTIKHGMQSDSNTPMSPVLHRMLVNEKATRLIQHALVGNEDQDMSKCMDEFDGHSHVPMILPIFITMVYILIGVFIYSQWEGWDFTEAFYFTFISLSTIGFGDFVSTGNYMMISIMYQLLGLALVAMTVTFLMELANATLGKAKYKVDQLAEKRFGFAVVENGVTPQRRVPIGIPLKNRKLKTQLSEFI